MTNDQVPLSAACRSQDFLVDFGKEPDGPVLAHEVPFSCQLYPLLRPLSMPCMQGTLTYT